jgi:chaperonin GroES
MLALEHNIKLNKKTISSPNIAEQFEEEDLRRISEFCLDCYKEDCFSRMRWEERTNAAMDLAMQIQKMKTFPWPGCSNIVFPLVTISSMQFHARAYPAIVNGRNVVQCRTMGKDPDGSKCDRAQRISTYMSWQLLEQDESWEEQQDKALLNVAIVGTAFKKSYYDASKGHNVSELVLAKDLILNYWAKSVDTCLVKTHKIPMYRNDIWERVQRGVFCDVTEEQWFCSDAQTTQNTTSIESDNRAGVTRPQSNELTPYQVLEQHNWMDLDGDGYAEPYIVTLEETTGCILRIVCRFDREEDIERAKDGTIIRIHATEYFTKIPFIPSPDGGIMDIGFGILLGPLNESVNSAINQLFDSGTISNTAGGFLGRGAKIRGGVYQFSPFQWNRVDSTGDDLRKSIYPLPVREPSDVMFKLLGLIIDYTNKISGATDMLTGVNPGQNTPAETARSMVEQGQKIYSAIFKRIWRSMKCEFKKLYQLNAVHMEDKVTFGGIPEYIGREDFLGDPSSIIPAADPTISSEGARFSRATILAQRAMANPGYDKDLVEQELLKALSVDNIEQVYPGLKSRPPMPPDVKIQVEQMKFQLGMANVKMKTMQHLLMWHEQRRVNDAKIQQLYSQAALFETQAGGVKAAHQLEVFKSQIDMLEKMNEHIDAQTKAMQETMNAEGTNDDSGGGVPGLAGPSSDQTTPGMGAPAQGGSQRTVG